MVLVNREMVAARLPTSTGKKTIPISIQDFLEMFLQRFLLPAIYPPVHHLGLIWATSLLEILAEKRMNVQRIRAQPSLRKKAGIIRIGPGLIRLLFKRHFSRTMMLK